jgi:hypothetical protein
MGITRAPNGPTRGHHGPEAQRGDRQVATPSARGTRRAPQRRLFTPSWTSAGLSSLGWHVLLLGGGILIGMTGGSGSGRPVEVWLASNAHLGEAAPVIERHLIARSIPRTVQRVPPPHPAAAVPPGDPAADATATQGLAASRDTSARLDEPDARPLPVDLFPAAVEAPLITSLAESPVRASHAQAAPALSNATVPPSLGEPAAPLLAHHAAVLSTEASDLPAGPGKSEAASPRSGLSIEVERPGTRTTHQGLQPLIGRVTGPAVQVKVELNGMTQWVDVWSGRFETEIALQPGSNDVRVTATHEGRTASRQIIVTYEPPPVSMALRILRPADETVRAEIVAVEGSLDVPGRPVRLVVEGIGLPAAQAAGRFSALIPRLGQQMRVWAETEGPEPIRSAPVSLRAAGARQSAYLVLHLPTLDSAAHATVWLTYRADAQRLRETAAVRVASAEPWEPGSALLYPLDPHPGDHALELEYRLPSGASIESGWGLILVPDGDRYRAWRLGPFQLRGAGRARLGRFLLPEGVFWEEGWHSGAATGTDGITRFRYGDGLVWAERRERPEAPVNQEGHGARPTRESNTDSIPACFTPTLSSGLGPQVAHACFAPDPFRHRGDRRP